MTTPNPTAVEARPCPPPLVTRRPDCSICGEETYYDGDVLRCDNCSAWWDPHGLDWEDGQWDDPAAERCDATVQPWLDNTWIKDDDERKRKQFRCVFKAGHHDENDPGNTRHANPEMGGVYAKGWQ